MRRTDRLYVYPDVGGMVVLPRILSIRVFFFTIVVVCAALAAAIVSLQGAATAPSNASLSWTPTVTPTPTATPTATPPTYHCFRPTDVMIAFDLSDSMDESGKLERRFDGRPELRPALHRQQPQPRPAPHGTGDAQGRRGLGERGQELQPERGEEHARHLRFVLDTSGYTNIGEALWRAEAQLAPNRPTVPDFIILLSDGAANRPDDLDDPSGTTETNDEVWLDVNDDGVVNSADDLTVDFKGNGDNDFVVVDGRLTWYTDKRALDATENGSLSNSDDYNFGSGRNFKLIDGRLRVDANGDGTISTSDDNELLIDRNGVVDS